MSSESASLTAAAPEPAQARRPAGRPALLAAGGMTLLGVSTGVSAVADDYPLLGGQAVRYLVAAVILSVLVAARPSWSGPRPGPLGLADLVRLIALAATGLAGFNICLIAALREASPATVGSVVGCTPLLLALIGPLRARRRPAAGLVAAATLVVAGAALTQGFGRTSTAGLVYSLGALAGEVAFSMLAVSLLPRLGAVRLSAYLCWWATGMLGLAAFVQDGLGMLRTPSPGELAALAYLAVVLTVVAFILWYTALPALGPARAGLFVGLVPVTAAASQAVLGLGRPSAAEIAGATLVGLGLTFGLRAAADDHPKVAPPAPVPVAASGGSRS
jgi:drug/metabolite transporter (DMT)-like permease